MAGSPGVDKLRGNDHNDTREGGPGPDRLEGDIGDDKLYGGTEPDRLNGYGGFDKYYAGAGDDTIYAQGDAERDVISCGAGVVDTVYYDEGVDSVHSLNCENLAPTQ